MKTGDLNGNIRLCRLLFPACAVAAAAAAVADEPVLTDLAFLPGDQQLGSAIQAQNEAQIAPGGPGYLVVWTDERAVLNGQTNAPESELSGNMLDIYGQILDTQGNPVGGPIVICNHGRNQRDPAVAWNGSAWFVAFEGDRPDWYFDNNIYGVRVAADGTVLDPDPILLFAETNGQGAYDPAVSSDGENWLVICDQWFGSPSMRTVRGRRIAPDGSPLDAQPVSMIQSSTLAYPDVAFANGVYLVAAQSYSNNALSFHRFDMTLNPLGALTPLAQGVSGQRVAVASNGSRFMVVGLKAHRIEPGGQVLDPAGIAIASNAYRDVAWTGNAWAVSSRMSSPEVVIGVQRIADDGSLLDAQPITFETSYLQDYTSIAGSGAGAAQVAFTTREFAVDDVSCARVSAGGAVSALQAVSISLPRQTGARLAPGMNNHLVVYTSTRHDQTRILAQRLSQNGAAMDAEPTVVQSGLPVGGMTADVAWNGQVYLVIWSQDGSVVGKRVSADNVVLDGQPIPIMPDIWSGPEGYGAGAVAAAGETFVVGGFHFIPFNEPVRYAEVALVSGSGEVLNSAPTLLAGGFSREMTAASFGDRAILAWAQYSIHDSASAFVQAAIIGESGVLAGTFRVSAQSGKEPDAIVGDGQALVVWHDDTAIHQENVEGRFVMPDGSMPFGEFAVSSAANEQMFPAAGWDGGQYVVAWNDYRHINGIEQDRADIRAARVLTDGSVLDPDGILVADSILPEDLPAVTGAGGRAIIMFSALHGPSDVPEIQRLGYRVLGPAAVPGDITADGVVNVNDLLAVINSWGKCANPTNCPADIAPAPNGDGVVNVNDLLMVINNWG